MKRYILILLIFLALTACGGATGGTAEQATDSAVDAAATPDPAAATETAADTADALAELQALVADADPVDALSADYSGALSVRTQLALGTVQLDSTDRAVTAEQAETLLPLWQALQSLENSGTAADMEVNAVINQIQAAMTPEQLGGIAAMRLSEDSLEDLSFFNDTEEDGGFGGFVPGGFDGGAPPDIGELPQGGAAGGGGAPAIQGGGPGGGGGIPGGGIAPGGGDDLGGEFDPSAMATRMAELADDPAAMAEQVAIGLVIRSLQRATGEFQMGGPGGGSYQALLTVLAEATGLEETAVRDELAAGATPADFLSAHDADAARAALVEALTALELGADTDVETLADELLAGTITMGPGGGMGGPAMDSPGNGGATMALLSVLAEATGLEAAAIQEELAAGTTPADFLSAHDADADAARAALIEALGALELGEDTDVEALADELLAGTTGQ